MQLGLPYCIIPEYHESLAFDWTCMLILFYRYEWNRKYSVICPVPTCTSNYGHDMWTFFFESGGDQVPN